MTARGALGRLLNTVSGVGPCPTCRRPAQMQVFEVAVRWAPCGHTRTLPPLSRKEKRGDAR